MFYNQVDNSLSSERRVPEASSSSPSAQQSSEFGCRQRFNDAIRYPPLSLGIMSLRFVSLPHITVVIRANRGETPRKKALDESELIPAIVRRLPLSG